MAHKLITWYRILKIIYSCGALLIAIFHFTGHETLNLFFGWLIVGGIVLFVLEEKKKELEEET
ncbi:MAG: hypothetical protein WCF60_02285 [Anaerobacillus sp.]